MKRTYTELKKLKTFEERLRYLKLDGFVGEDLFGSNRELNQIFYKSRDWRQLRKFIITRDLGCDLAIPGMDILGTIYIHHINPIEVDDVIQHSDLLLDPDNLICVSDETHRAIHYGLDEIVFAEPVVRKPNDTCPWR